MGVPHIMALVHQIEYSISDPMDDEGLQIIALFVLLAAARYSIVGQSSGVARIISVLRGLQGVYDVDNLVWIYGPPTELSKTGCLIHSTEAFDAGETHISESRRHSEIASNSWEDYPGSVFT